MSYSHTQVLVYQTNVADINPGSANALTDTFYVANNKLFFTANNGVNGFELWWYDGLSSPALVSDIYTGSSSSSPKYFSKYKGKLYFSAINTGIGRELWSLCLKTSGTDVISACHSYTWISGNTYNSNNSTATHTITNSFGCDSIVTLNLTIKPKTYKNITTSACASYSLNAQTYTTSGVYTQTLTNSVVCDSIITLNLTIKPKTYKNITTSACNSYSLNTQTYTTSGVYTQTLTNSVGCDSIITLNLTITILNTSISVFGQTIVSNETGASYQWIACSNNSVAINGATSNSYTATNLGTYAVILSKNGCTDTSFCTVINTTNLKEHTVLTNLLIHPNPSINGIFYIRGLDENAQINIYNELGETVYLNKTNKTDSIEIDLRNKANGIYYIRISTSEESRVIKVVKLGS